MKSYPVYWVCICLIVLLIHEVIIYGEDIMFCFKGNSGALAKRLPPGEPRNNASLPSGAATPQGRNAHQDREWEEGTEIVLTKKLVL